MIKDRREIDINAAPESVFNHIDAMPNKFPVYKIFETPPFFFIRMVMVDGLLTAVEAIRKKNTAPEALYLETGDIMGPFTLIEKKRPSLYIFELNARFFNCTTGYRLVQSARGTRLFFDTISKNPAWRERIWWFCIRPVHIFFANKVLKLIKEQAEYQTPSV